jgi:hypothetical protein
MTAQKSAFYIELTKGSLAVDFRWILLVVDKIVDKVPAALVAFSGKQILSVGRSSAQIVLKRSLDTIPSRKPNAEKAGRSI